MVHHGMHGASSQQTLQFRQKFDSFCDLTYPSEMDPDYMR
jgi:hypothetical protein